MKRNTVKTREVSPPAKTSRKDLKPSFDLSDRTQRVFILKDPRMSRLLEGPPESDLAVINSSKMFSIPR